MRPPSESGDVHSRPRKFFRLGSVIVIVVVSVRGQDDRHPEGYGSETILLSYCLFSLKAGPKESTAVKQLRATGSNPVPPTKEFSPRVF